MYILNVYLKIPEYLKNVKLFWTRWSGLYVIAITCFFFFFLIERGHVALSVAIKS